MTLDDRVRTAVDGPDEPSNNEWWRTAVIYQIYPRSFADSNGDGIGDLPAITARLPHLSALGIDAIWLSPFYVSPQVDAGYDVADYCDVDPLFGTLEDFDALRKATAAAGIRLIVDLVPNHSSDLHPWFQAALASVPGSRERDRYIFRDGRGIDGDLPPNNWESVFGGLGWKRVEGQNGPDQWYLHLFDAGQPDFDWSNPEVADFFDDVLRFWLDRGVDGFRVDVAHGLVKDSMLPDATTNMRSFEDAGTHGPMWDQEAVHDIYRRWHNVLSEYPGERMLVAEAWVTPIERLARYVRPDEMQQAFNFPYMKAGWNPAQLRAVIDNSLAANEWVGAPTTWVLSSHDSVRHTSRFGLSNPNGWPNGIGPDDEQPDAARGLARARAATMFMLALPGAAYLYQGEELGLPEHTALPASARQDPTFLRTNGEDAGRDGARIPLPWKADAPGLGFGPSDKTWLPQPDGYRELAVDRQESDPTSTLALYRSALALRKREQLGDGTLEWVETAGSVLDFRNGHVRVITNFGDAPVPLPKGTRVILHSDPAASALGTLAPNDTVWLTE